MTRRSVLLGLVGAALVCGFCFFNDWILRQTYLVGNNMPPSIYGVLILVAIVVNPLLRHRALTGGELAVILALTLAAASIPGGGLLRTLIPSLVMPHHIEKTVPAWREESILAEVPPRMLTDTSEDEDTVVNGYVQGLGTGDRHVSPRAVPWRAWVRPLAYWLPLALTLWLGLIGLTVAVHHQWSRNEHLPYPVARFTDALFPARPGSRSPVRDPLFRAAALMVLAIHMNNFAAVGFPQYLVTIPTQLDFSPVGTILPVLVKGQGSVLLRPHLYLIIIGLAFFIPGDVSFSFGIGPFVWHLLAGVFAGYGIGLMSPVEGTGYFALKPQSFALFGANAGVAAAVLYTGRHYYAGLVRSCAGLAAPDTPPRHAVWGARVFAVAAVLLVCQLRLVGIRWVFAVPYVAIMTMGFLILARVIAETGLIYLKCYFWPCATLWGLLGAGAAGPRQLLLMMLVTTVLFIDPREALAPFMANSLKLLEANRVSLGRPAILCAAAVVLGLCVAVPVTLYFRYDMGNSTGDSWATNTVPRVAFDNAVAIRRKLAAQGIVTAPGEATDGDLRRFAPDPLCAAAAAAGFALVLGCTVARLRNARWPIHPLMFVTWCATPLRLMGFSYFVGWGVKTLITHYGGSRTYNRLKPLFLGMIAGEVLAALIPSLVGLVFYLWTGNRPVVFNVLPG